MITISRGTFKDQFYPHHLLYNFVNYQFFHVWQLFGYGGNAELPVKVLNVLAGLSAFPVRDLPYMESVFLLVLSFTALLLVAFIVLQVLRRDCLTKVLASKVNSPHASFLLAISICYLVIYSLFNIWWEPQNIEFWISLVPFSMLVFGLLVNPIAFRANVKISMVAVLGCLFFTNLFGSVLPQTNRECDYWYVSNSWLLKNCRPGDLNVSGSGYISDAYVQFYSGAKVFSTLQGLKPEEGSETLEIKFKNIVAKLGPKRIFFTSTVASPLKEVIGRSGGDSSISREFFEKMSNQLVLINSDSYQDLYLYESLQNEIYY